MDADQLRELATNALTGHWPAHLGVNTDQEKIEHLARAIEKAADDIRDADALEERADEAETECSELKAEIEEVEQCVECVLCGEHKAEVK